MEIPLSKHSWEKMAHFLPCLVKSYRHAHAPAATIQDPTLVLAAEFPKLTCMFRVHLHFLLEWRTYHQNYSFEAQINTSSWTGQVSQSFQIAPFDYQYRFNEDGIAIRNNAISKTNSYKGGPYQQAVSVLTDVPNNSYGGAGWIKLGFEYWGNSKDRQNSYITWYVNDVESWTTTPASIEADSTTQINARLISEEPMVSSLDIVRRYRE